MLCPKCGKDVGENIGLCPECEERQRFFSSADPSSASSASVERIPGPQVWAEHSAGDLPDAGFFYRFIAVMLDAAVLFILFKSFHFLFGDYLENSVDTFIRSSAEISTISILGVSLEKQLPVILLFFLPALILGWIYYALLECTPLQATVGKLALGLAVTGPRGERASFARVSIRYFAKLVSFLIFGIGFLLAVVTERKQALHDLLAECYVVKCRRVSANRFLIVTCLAVILFFGLPMLFSGERAAKHSPSWNHGVPARVERVNRPPKKYSTEVPEAISMVMPVAGIVRGMPFSPERIEYSPYTKMLMFRQGERFVSDIGVLIFLFLDQPLVESQMIKVDRKSGNEVPHIHMKWKKPGRKDQKTKIFSSNKSYEMTLQFTRVSETIVSGNINLTLLDGSETKILGRFDAVVK